MFKKLFSRKPVEEEYGPMDKFLDLLISEALERGVDMIVFGEPPDSLPREPVDESAGEEKSSVIREEEEQLARDWGISLKKEDLDLNRTFDLKSDIPGHFIPIWYRNGGVWKRRSCLPPLLLSSIMSRAETRLSVHAWEAHNGVGESCLEIRDKQGNRIHVNLELWMEKNFCYSIRIPAARS